MNDSNRFENEFAFKRARGNSMQHNSAKMLLHSPSILARFAKSFKSIKPITLIYTILIFFNHFAFGICVNIIGATMVDLAYIYNVPLNTVSQMVVANNIGYTSGALAGYMYKWVNRQLMLVVFSLFIGLSTIAMPHYGSVWAIFVAITINGIGCGAWDAANSVWLVDMWPVGATAVLQAAQFMYGGGITLAPVLVQNYVFGERNMTDDNRTLTIEIRKEYLTIPYVVSGVLQSVAPVFFVILFVKHRYVKEDHNDQTGIPSLSSKIDLNNNLERCDHSKTDLEIISINSENTSVASKVPWRKMKLVLCGICLASYFSAENGYYYYCTAMLQYTQIHLSAVEATQVTSVLSFFYTFGPLVTAIVSLKLKPDHIISYHFVFLITGISTIFFFQTNITLVYIGSATLGYGFSAMVPAINAFTERHFRFSDTVASMYTFTCGATSLVIPIVLGQNFEDNPELLMYLVAVYIAVSLLFFLIVRLWITLSHK